MVIKATKADDGCELKEANESCDHPIFSACLFSVHTVNSCANVHVSVVCSVNDEVLCIFVFLRAMPKRSLCADTTGYGCACKHLMSGLHLQPAGDAVAV